MQRKMLFGSIVGCLAILFLFSSVGFAQQEAAKPFKWPAMLRIATPTTQSASFASTNGWGPILQKEVGVNVRVVPEDSEIRRYSRFALQKEFELVSTSIAEVAYSLRGESGYAVMPAAAQRVVWHHNDTPWGIVTRGDSKYKTIYDLKQKGVRVAVSTQSPPMMVAMQEAIPAFIGWTKEEAAANWTYIPVGSYPENCRTVTDGKADVAYVTPISSITFEMEAHPQGLRWLALPASDKAGWDGYLNLRPTAIPSTIDFGVPSAKGVESIASNFIYWTRPDVDQELVYQMAKWFHTRFDTYKGVHAIAKRMSIEHMRKFLDRSAFPVAEGTIRYLREIGMWTEADDQWNQQQLELMERWIAARNAVLKEAKEKKIKIHWQDKEYLDLLQKHTKDIPVFRTRL